MGKTAKDVHIGNGRIMKSISYISRGHAALGHAPLVARFKEWLAVRNLRRLRRGATGFEATVLGLMAEAARNKVTGRNIDPWRFPGEQPWDYATRLGGVIEFVQANADRLAESNAQLSDATSKEMLLEHIVFQALGPRHVKCSTNTDAFWEAFRLGEEARVGEPIEQYGGFDMYRFRVELPEDRVELVCWLGNVIASFYLKQYFFQRDEVKIAPEPGDIVFDLGACFGDTAITFASVVGDHGHVYSFDPHPRHREIFERNLLSNPTFAKRTTFVESALSDVSGEWLSFSTHGAASRLSRSGSHNVTSLTVDDFAKENSIKTVDFIKMDIEGAELEALRGSRRTIQEFGPNLAISIYHDLEHLYQIGELIISYNPSYRFWIDHHSIHAEELILYAKII